MQAKRKEINEKEKQVRLIPGTELPWKDIGSKEEKAFMERRAVT